MNKRERLDRGFTLLELIIGLLILGIVTTLSLNALNQAGESFSKDKKSIESSQNLSAVMQMIGNDIQQAGEQIGQASFPAIEFQVDAASTADTANTISPRKSSRIIIRKAVALDNAQFTLCQNIPVGGAIPATLVVRQNGTGNTNCEITTPPDFTFYPPTPTNPISPRGSLQSEILARQYRCQIDNPDSNFASATTSLCNNVGSEKIRAAISDGMGRIRVFDYIGDNFTGSAAQYTISTSNAVNTPRDTGVAYPIGSPIYLIEERVYQRDNSGNLTLSVDGGTPQVLITKIAQFNVSARLYDTTTTTDRPVQPNPVLPAVTAPQTTIPASQFNCPASTQPTSPTVDNPKYICQFNYNTLATDVPMNWKNIAGIKVELQSAYNPAGTSSSSPAARDVEKLSARAEFFPRNVLSK